MKFKTLSDHKGVNGLQMLGQITLDFNEILKQDWTQDFINEISSNENKTDFQFILDVIRFVFGKAPKETLSILAHINEISIEEADQWSLPKIGIAISALANDKETIDFFMPLFDMEQELSSDIFQPATDLEGQE